MKLLLSIIIFCYLINFNLRAQLVSVPYTNGFETPLEISEWTHYSLAGTDDWVVGNPSNFGSVNTNAWVTSLNSNCALNSTRCIETPDFDFSNLNGNKVLSFYQQRLGSNCHYYLEYSTNLGVSWQLLDDVGAPKLSWQGSSGWTGNFFGSMFKSAIRINFLEGNINVRFRFRFISQGNTSRGWIIDDFSILDEFINVNPSVGQAIEGLTPFFSQFTISNSFNYITPYNVPTLFKNSFYLSTDNNFDNTDVFLGNVNITSGTTIQNWNNTFNLPQGLLAGDYYIVTRLDTLNILEENIENDNISFTLLRLKESIPVNYIDNFDSVTDTWNKVGYVNDTTWRLGDPNNWHIENSHSLPNSWFSWRQLIAPSPPDLESPFINLTTSSNNSICFWYNHSGFSDGYFYLKLPDLMGSTIGVPTFNNPANRIQIPTTRRYGWDCYCKDISQWDNQQSTKFRLEAWGDVLPISTGQSSIDDIYIGTKKPDVSIESNSLDRFTNSQTSIHSLDYILYNSGLSTLPVTQTDFYWSIDSVLDSSDEFLISVNEPELLDTTFINRSVTFIKPTLTPGKYYVLWITDASNLVDEMREYNNEGSIVIRQNQIENLPYSNDFETQIDGWRHDATLGHDDWQWDSPNGVQISQAFSGQKGFVTNGGGDTVSKHSRSHLYSPIFDLSQLTTPVLEFDLFAMFYHIDFGYTYWPYNLGNIMYSVDGGCNWQVLEPQNKSFKRMYSIIEFDDIVGFDEFLSSNTLDGDLLYGKNQPSFMAEWDYQSRRYDDNSHYVIDLSFLAGLPNVQFMFVYANENAPMEGLLLDNFSIKEHQTDLCITTNKKILAASGDKKIRTFFHVQNQGNYIVPETQLTVYSSIDSLLDASDILITSRIIDTLRPYEKQLVVLNENSPLNFGNYHYLLCNIDANNNVYENNELNNVHVFDFAMDSCFYFNYPIQFNFEEKFIDGWSWDHDSTGFYHGHTFRTQKVISDPVYGSNNGEWFMDPLDKSGYNIQLANYPTFHLYSPTFDFSLLYNINLSFDMMCITGTSSIEGGNLSYSIDGGITWIVLFNQDQNAINWYNTSSISELMGQPGWIFINNWQNCQFNLSFLAGQSNVQFKFSYKGKTKYNSPGAQGFKMDNFILNGTSVDLLTQNNTTIVEATLTNQTISVNYQLETIAAYNFDTLKTGFYWSENPNFDGNDLFIGEFQESLITPNFSGTISKSLNYPFPILQNTYYLFHILDHEHSINEINENNNLGMTEVHFDNTNLGFDEFNFIQSIKTNNNGYEIYFNKGEILEVDLLNMLGQKISSQNVNPETGFLLLQPKGISTGTYLLKINSDRKTSIIRLFFQSNN